MGVPHPLTRFQCGMCSVKCGVWGDYLAAAMSRRGLGHIDVFT